MKDETKWNYSECLIGIPCNSCIETCSFKIKSSSLDKGQDEKEKENERISKGTEAGY
jgi:hypothetical protein